MVFNIILVKKLLYLFKIIKKNGDIENNTN